ncbi:MAG: hypothetical protein LUB59_07130 [Candidatus Gastranaerophilales bacterium]|nr:hypothetical protein [Candidatus Gastranaerophilales bacterium]
MNITGNIYSNNCCSVSGSNRNIKPAFTGLTKLPAKKADEFVSSKLKKTSPENFFKRLISKTFHREAPEPATPKIADNLHELLVGMSKKTSYANGKDAVVHSIPGQDGFVMRIEKSAIPKINKLSDKLTLVPIKYNKPVAENENFGLPLYLVAEEGSKIAKKTSVSPLEALAQPDKIMVLRKMTGNHPSQEYWDKLTTLMGYDDFHPSYDQLNNFHFLGYVRANFGNDAAINCLENCKNGMTKFKPNQIAEGSPEFEFVDGGTFYKNYRAFSDSYIKSLKNISEMPQKSYDKAIKNILAPDKGFIMDFQHTDNTFVDFEHNEFNFMDFCFDKSLYPKYYYDNPIKEFRNVLMGKCFSKQFKSPRQLIIYPDDIAQVKTFSNAINEKVNIAAPEKYRSEPPFKIK